MDLSVQMFVGMRQCSLGSDGDADYEETAAGMCRRRREKSCVGGQERGSYYRECVRYTVLWIHACGSVCVSKRRGLAGICY